MFMLKCSLYVSRAKVYLNLVKLIFLIFHVYRVLEGYHRPAVTGKNEDYHRKAVEVIIKRKERREKPRRR